MRLNPITVAALDGGPEADAGPRRLVGTWVDAFNAQDLDRLVALYVPDAVLWGTFAPTLITGRAGIHAYFARSFVANPGLTVQVEDLHLQLLADDAIAAGRYGLHVPAPATPTVAAVDAAGKTMPARFSFVLQRQGGAWTVVHHHSSLNPSDGRSA